MAQQQSNSMTVYRDLLQKQASQFAMVMPQETVDRFMRIVITNLGEHPEIQRCEPRSVMQVCMRAAQDGLMLDGKEAAIVPMAGIATYVPMIFGIRKKVRATGMLSDWNVQVVQEGDEFDYALGDRPYIQHRPSMRGGRKRPVVAAYSVATFPDGTKSYEIMNIDQIEDIRSKSKAKSGPWSDPIFFPEMCRKTVARLHSKQLPQSSDISAFFKRMDDDDNAGGRELEPPPARRIPTVAGALDEFGAGRSPKAIEQQEEQSTESAAPSGNGKKAPAESEQVDAVDLVKRAFRRGQEDRKAGKPDTVPEEYQENSRNREQIAWTCGYDGKPLPEWRAGK